MCFLYFFFGPFSSLVALKYSDVFASDLSCFLIFLRCLFAFLGEKEMVWLRMGGVRGELGGVEEGKL